MKKYLSPAKLLFLVVLGWLVHSTNGVKAQKPSYELWPEVDVWYKVKPDLRLSALAAVTRYLESDTRDFNLTLQGDYAFGKSKHFLFSGLLDHNQANAPKTWLVRGGYLGGRSLRHASDYTESRLSAEIHRRFLLKQQVLFLQRLRMDNRWLGKNFDFSYRFSYRAMFEREFLTGKTYLTPYISVEPYWDSRFEVINRIKVISGTTVSWKPRFAFEGNFTYQHDSKPSPSSVLAFNIVLHLYFESEKVRQNSGR